MIAHTDTTQIALDRFETAFIEWQITKDDATLHNAALELANAIMPSRVWHPDTNNALADAGEQFQSIIRAIHDQARLSQNSGRDHVSTLLQIVRKENHAFILSSSKSDRFLCYHIRGIIDSTISMEEKVERIARITGKYLSVVARS